MRTAHWWITAHRRQFRSIHAPKKTVMISPRQSFISVLGYTLVGGPPERFSEFIRSETEKWAKVIKAAGIPMQ